MNFKIFNVVRLAIGAALFMAFIVVMTLIEGVPVVQVFWKMVSLAVFAGGWLNAYGLATQTTTIWRTGRGEGHSLQMYGLFLFIQVSLALNGIKHDDWAQASGMFASMIPTIWSMALIRHFLKNPRS